MTRMWDDAPLRPRSYSIGALLLLALAGCDADVERWRERQAAIDPPLLWQVQALQDGAVVRTVTVCADSVLHAGFTQPLPVSGGQGCETLGEPVSTDGRRTLVCAIGRRRFEVESTVDGDTREAFTVAFSARPARSSPDGAYTQTLRYTRLGACPEGWRIGDHTDRHGRRHGDARRQG